MLQSKGAFAASIALWKFASMQCGACARRRAQRTRWRRGWKAALAHSRHADRVRQRIVNISVAISGSGVAGSRQAALARAASASQHSGA